MTIKYSFPFPEIGQGPTMSRAILSNRPPTTDCC